MINITEGLNVITEDEASNEVLNLKDYNFGVTIKTFPTVLLPKEQLISKQNFVLKYL